MNNPLALLTLVLSSSSYLNPIAAFVVTTGRHLLSTTSVAPSATRQRVHHHDAATSSSQLRPELRVSTSIPYHFHTYRSDYTWRRQVHRQQLLAATATADGAVVMEDTTPYEQEISLGHALAPLDSHVQRFEEWLTRINSERADCADEGGGANGEAKIRLLHADFNGLRGVMTVGPVRPWEPLVTLPMSSALQEYVMPDNPKSLPPPEPLSVQAWERCPWWVRLGVRLLKEKTLGEASSLASYVGILSKEVTPLNWTAEQLERLYYPRLLSQVAVQQRLFRGFRKFLLADATRTSTHTSDGERLVGALSDPSAFNWALECVLSRAFQLPPDSARRPSFEDNDDGEVPVWMQEVEPPAPSESRMALLPLIDSLNHYSRMPTTMYWEENGASISVAVGAHLDPGDHAFLSYGMVSNDDLLQYYGFVERENPSDTYVLQDMGKSLREDGLLTAELEARLLLCPAARETWRYLRKGVLLRDAVHPITMQAVRLVCCERTMQSGIQTADDDNAAQPTAAAAAAAAAAVGLPLPLSGEEKKEELPPLPWDGTEADLARFATPVSLATEIAALELILRSTALEADAWGYAGVACAFAEDPTADGLDGDLDGLGLDDDRRLMLSVFRQEKVRLLRGIVSRLTHMRKVSDLLQRPIKMPAMRSPPPVLGTSVRC